MKKMLLLALPLFFFTCTGKQESAETEIHTTETHEHENEEIQLDEGKRWKVPEEMMQYLRSMENAINSFENNTEKDYVALARLIDRDIRMLTENCTMEGQGHDELHKWLVPYIELSEDFDLATETAEQEKIYQAFKQKFEVFNTYFE